MIAAWYGMAEFVKVLCEDNRTSLNQQDANGFTALMKACINGYFENKIKDIRKILIDAGADTKIVDMNGACGVINENVVEKFKDQLYTIRVSQNSFVGSSTKIQKGERGPDTTMRLFNQI